MNKHIYTYIYSKDAKRIRFNKKYIDVCSECEDTIGYICNRNRNDDIEAYINIDDNLYPIYKTNKSRMFGLSLKGYVRTSEGLFVSVYLSNYFLLAIISFMICLLLIASKNICLNKLDIDDNQSDIGIDEINNNTTSNNVLIPGYSSIRIIGADVITDLYNPSGNEYEDEIYYLQFFIYLNDEIIYESKLIEPNKHLTNIQINKDISNGTYDGYLYVQPYKKDRVSKCNNAKIKLKIIKEEK